MFEGKKKTKQTKQKKKENNKKQTNRKVPYRLEHLQHSKGPYNYAVV
jgi:hypothetical protein